MEIAKVHHWSLLVAASCSQATHARLSTATDAGQEAASAARETELDKSQQRNIEVVNRIKPHGTIWGIQAHSSEPLNHAKSAVAAEHVVLTVQPSDVESRPG